MICQKPRAYKVDVSASHLYLLVVDGKGHIKPAVMLGWSVPVGFFDGQTRTLEGLNINATELIHAQCQSENNQVTLEWALLVENVTRTLTYGTRCKVPQGVWNQACGNVWLG
jgi:hypothetical protein